MAMNPYGRAPKPTVFQQQQVARTAPVSDVQAGPALDRIFWKQTLIEGIAAATTTVMVFFVMREVEKRWK